MSTANLNGKGIIRGAALTAIVGATASVLAIYAVPKDSSANFALTIILLAGLVLGGFAAGREAPDYPFMNGAVAALLGFGMAEAVGIVIHLAKGDSVNPFRVVFLALLSGSCGIVGGAFASAAHNRALAREQADNEQHTSQGET